MVIFGQITIYSLRNIDNEELRHSNTLDM